jgi:hypothetical protein
LAKRLLFGEAGNKFHIDLLSTPAKSPIGVGSLANIIEIEANEDEKNTTEAVVATVSIGALSLKLQKKRKKVM